MTINKQIKKLYLVGIGPGQRDYILPRAQQVLEESTDIVGYSLYIELLADLAMGKQCHISNLGDETKRARLALDLAGAGKVTALVSSGDIGIYAMASLVFELLDKEGGAQWSDIEIICVPGVSAMQVAASKMGAPLGHDFCSISLSDLLTPWSIIEKRLHAAGHGDFVVALYNPVSKTRNWQFDQAVTILLKYRESNTPVIIAKNLTRDNESFDAMSLADINAKNLDMLTTVIIGNSESRQILAHNKHWVYTPRGYSTKPSAIQ